MKKYFLFVFFIYIILFFIPIITTFILGNLNLKTLNTDQNLSFKEDKINLYYIENGREKTIPLEDYVIGVVAAEMPALFENDALMAQAVASRTYALKHIDLNAKNNIYDIGQEFITKETMQNNWGENFDKYYNKISSAVNKTKGEILVYDNEPIEAVFHSTSGGVTLNSKDVWNIDLPYLKSVDSKIDENAPNFLNEIKFEEKELIKIFKSKYSDIDFKSFSFLNDFKIEEKINGNYVTKVKVGNKILTGNEVRNILNLKSTNFIIKKEDDNIIIITKGYGHGAGMSQNGANLLAKEGYDYREILNHYYSFVIINKLK